DVLGRGRSPQASSGSLSVRVGVQVLRGLFGNAGEVMRRIVGIPWIILTAIVVHAGWGLLLLSSAATLGTTPLAGSAFSRHRYLAAAVYLGAACLASLPFLWRRLDMSL